MPQEVVSFRCSHVPAAGFCSAYWVLVSVCCQVGWNSGVSLPPHVVNSLYLERGLYGVWQESYWLGAQETQIRLCVKLAASPSGKLLILILHLSISTSGPLTSSQGCNCVKSGVFWFSWFIAQLVPNRCSNFGRAQLSFAELLQAENWFSRWPDPWALESCSVLAASIWFLPFPLLCSHPANFFPGLLTSIDSTKSVLNKCELSKWIHVQTNDLGPRLKIFSTMADLPRQINK